MSPTNISLLGNDNPDLITINVIDGVPHNPVSTVDSPEIALTLNNQELTANINNYSVEEIKLSTELAEKINDTSFVGSVTVSNTSGVFLEKGTPVFISGNDGTNIEVGKADINNSANLILDEDIIAGNTGSAKLYGTVNDISVIDASIYSPGDILWLAETGGLTNIKPSTTTVQRIGVITSSDPLNNLIGIFFYNDLTVGDVALTSITDYATSAQGALADSALQPEDIGVSVQGFSTILDNTTESFITEHKDKIDLISVTEPVDLDVAKPNYIDEYRDSSVGVNDVIPVHYFGAFGAETNIDTAILPKGDGSFSLDVPDGTVTGGNKRGRQSVDLQQSRLTANQVASGDLSFAAGYRNTVTTDGFALGFSNTTNAEKGGAIGAGNSVDGYSSVAIGLNNTITNSSGIGRNYIFGSSNTLSDTDYAVLLGTGNTIQSASAYSTVAGGRASTIDGSTYSFIGSSNISSITNSANSSIVSANGASIVNSRDSFIGVGLGLSITDSAYSSILSGQNNAIDPGGSNSNYSTIVGGFGNNISEGPRSALLGGVNNIVTGFNSAILAGDSNTINGNNNVASGFQNNVTGGRSFAFGSENQINASYSISLGSANEITTDRTIVLGDNGKSFIPFSSIFSSGSEVSTGDSQRVELLLRNVTVDNTTATLLTTTSANTFSNNNTLVPQDNSVMAVECRVTAIQQGTTNIAEWIVKFTLAKGVGAGTIVSKGIVDVVERHNDLGLNIDETSLFVDATNGGATLRVYGLAATNIKWLAHCVCTENIYV